MTAHGPKSQALERFGLDVHQLICVPTWFLYLTYTTRLERQRTKPLVILSRNVQLARFSKPDVSIRSILKTTHKILKPSGTTYGSNFWRIHVQYSHKSTSKEDFDSKFVSRFVIHRHAEVVGNPEISRRIHGRIYLTRRYVFHCFMVVSSFNNIVAFYIS